MKYKRYIIIAAVLAASVLLIVLLRNVITQIITPVLAAAVQAYLFIPLIKPLEKRVNRSFAIILAFLITTSVNVSVIMLLVPMLVSQLKEFITVFPQYVDSLTDFLSHYTRKFNELGLKNINFDLESMLFSNINEKIASFKPDSVMPYFSSLLLAPVVVFYFLRDREKIRDGCLFMLPKNMRSSVFFMFKNINYQLRDYVMGQFSVIILVSALMGITLAIAGFRYWIILGIIMGLLNVIPYIGPVLGSVPILLVGAIDGGKKFFLGLILIIAVQQVDNLIIQPNIIGNCAKIHPVTVLLCVIGGNALGGLVGMVLAIPLYIILRISIKEFYGYLSERSARTIKAQ